LRASRIDGAIRAVPRQADLEPSAVVARIDHQPSTESGDPLPEHNGPEVALGQLGVLEASAERDALTIVGDRDPHPLAIEPATKRSTRCSEASPLKA